MLQLLLSLLYTDSFILAKLSSFLSRSRRKFFFVRLYFMPTSGELINIRCLSHVERNLKVLLGQCTIHQGLQYYQLIINTHIASKYSIDFSHIGKKMFGQQSNTLMSSWQWQITDSPVSCICSYVDSLNGFLNDGNKEKAKLLSARLKLALCLFINVPAHDHSCLIYFLHFMHWLIVHFVH